MTITFSAGLVLALILSCIYYTYIASVVRPSSNEVERYLYGSSSLSSHQIFGTFYASGLSFATVIVALLQLGVFFGIALTWAILTYCLGWLLFVAYAARIKDALLPHETIHTFLGRRLKSRSIARFASFATIAGFVGSFAIEILAIDLILGAFIESSILRAVLILLVATATIGYAVIGGFPAIIKTDRIQSYLIILTILLILALAMSFRTAAGGAGIVSVDGLHKMTLPLKLTISLFLINVLFPIVDMAAWQRAKAAATLDSLKKGAIFAAIIFAITWGALLFASMAVSDVLGDQKDPIIAIFGYGSSIEGVAGFIVSFVLLSGLLAAMFSTADTFLNAAATTMYVDQIQSGSVENEKLKGRNVSSSNTFRIRSLTGVLGVIGFLSCLALSQIGFGIVALIFALYGGTIALFPSITYALCSQSENITNTIKVFAIASVIAGFVAAWITGFHGVMCSEASEGFCVAMNNVIAPDAYQAPIAAFVCSSTIFLCGLIISRLIQQGKK